MANKIKVDDFLNGVHDLIDEYKVDVQEGTDKYLDEYQEAKQMFLDVAPEIKASYDHLAEASHTYTQAMIDRFNELAGDIDNLYDSLFPEESSK